MKIGIDIDDTIADTFDYVMPYIAKFYELDIEYLKENNISYNTLTKEMKKESLNLQKNIMIKLFLIHHLSLM